jgi:hypothetical protein
MISSLFGNIMPVTGMTLSEILVMHVGLSFSRALGRKQQRPARLAESG